MRKLSFAASICAAALISLSGTVQADIIVVGGSTANGNFQATTDYAGSGGNANTALFNAVSGWVNLGAAAGTGGGETAGFGAKNQLGASPDPDHPPTQGAFLSINNTAANTTGYTVGAAGDVLDFSIFYNAQGGAAGYGDSDANAPGNGNLDDESIVAFLFTSTSGSTATTVQTDITRLASASVNIDRGNNGTLTGQYTAVAGDVGNTIYYGIELLNPTGPGNPFPRIDLAVLDATSAVPEPSSIALLGLVGLAGVVRRKRS